MRWNARAKEANDRRTVRVWLWWPRIVDNQWAWMEHADRHDACVERRGRIVWRTVSYDLRDGWSANWPAVSVLVLVLAACARYF